MMFGKTRLELKVGVFVFIGLVILITFVLLIGDFKTWGSGRKITFVFNFINGVKLGAPVRFAGMDVGEVKEIKVQFSEKEQKTQLHLVGIIKKEIKVPIDSTVWVNTLGLLGEKYVEIIPGKDYKHCVTESQLLKGEDPLATHEMSVLAKNIADNLNDSIIKLKNKEGTVGKLLYDDTMYNEIEALIKNKEGTIGRLFFDDTLYKELEALLVDLKAHPWKLFWKGKEKKPAKK